MNINMHFNIKLIAYLYYKVFNIKLIVGFNIKV